MAETTNEETSSKVSVADAKQNAAHRAVDENIDSTIKVIGIGSGSTIVFAVERIAQLQKEGKLSPDVVCIPTSFQATQLIRDQGLPLGSLEINPEIEVAIDGADEVDSFLNCIKGGGGCHFQEKLVAYNCKKFVVIADWRKESTKLGTNWKKGVPVSVYPAALQPVKLKIEKLGGKPTLRLAKQKAGPVVTDDGALILDVDFGIIEPQSVTSMDQQLHMIPGVIETGFFTNAACAYFGLQDGTVRRQDLKSKA